MASEILGLFQTPEQYQAAQDEAMRSRFLQAAQLTPLQQASLGYQQAGYQAGQAIGGALGGVDPQLRLIAQRQALTSSIDLTNPESVILGAQKASQMGDTQLATVLSDRAKALQESLTKQRLEQAQTIEKYAGIPKTQAETSKLMTEAQTRDQTIKSLMSRFQLNEADATAIANNPKLVESYMTPSTAQAFDILKSGKFTPESAAVFARTGNYADLEHFDMSVKPSEAWITQAKALGLEAKPNFNAYTPEEVAKVNKAVFNNEIELKRAGAIAIKIPLGEVLNQVYLSADRKAAAENWAQAGEAYKATVPMVDKLSKLETSISNAFTGTGADAKLAIAKGLSAVGVKISDRATDTEIANAISSQVVQQIAKVFPGSQSNKELDQLLKSKFNIQQELPTILRLIRQSKDEMLAQTKTYEQGSKLNDDQRSKFNANLAQGQNYLKIQQYRDFEDKYRKGTITPEERATAAKLKAELGL